MTILHPVMPSDDWIQLHDEPIGIDAVVAFVTSPAAGGIDVFIGATRDETDPEGRRLVALDYEVYLEMADVQLHELAARARARWPIIRLAVLHRVGRVPVGHPSVVIAVACPHRAEAFEACHWLIDTLKAEVAIWKKEVWRKGLRMKDEG